MKDICCQYCEVNLNKVFQHVINFTCDGGLSFVLIFIPLCFFNCLYMYVSNQTYTSVKKELIAKIIKSYAFTTC